ncbi:uncharacterized protein LOC110377526 [Helicoverpa armigera]|uniref:uncharacterized protein LOC110377526 n=1 Tax=Helicoverpa armigera TaxID=29058 RepID=UPI0030830942
MSRFVAGFITILYVCAVSGQQQRGPPNDSSIRVGSVTGGSYPDGAFSINYGDGKGPMVPSSANVPQREEDLRRLKATNDSIAVGVVSGANFGDGAFSVNRDDNKPAPNNGAAAYDRPNNGYDGPNNGYDRPNNGYDSPNNGQGFAYDNNHLGDSQNPPYYGNKYDRRTTEAPASNSGTDKKGFFSTVRSYLSKWFFF